MSENSSESGLDANRLTATTTSIPAAGTQRAERPPPMIPDHEVLRLIGRGSYGEVWLARTALGSLRAVKVVYRESFDHDRPYEREFEGIKKFEPISHARESQVDIFHVGRNDAAGFFYYIMELADSIGVQSPESKVQSQPTVPCATLDVGLGTLDERAYSPRTLKHELRTRGALPVSECVQIALPLTRALEHLHARGLVHRDIKPSNIIFVNGVPKLADIGLVTSVDATRSFVGTDGYIPPEGPGTPQADLYSLGKVLYECVTGKDRLDFPELPADWRTRSDFGQLLEFNEILTKACDSDPQQRYQNADEMNVDLVLLQHGESVRNKRVIQQHFVFLKRIGFGAAALGVLSAALWFVLTNVNWLETGSTERKATFAQKQEARRLYSLAITNWRNTQAGLERGIRLLNLAIAEDQNYAPAYSELAYRFSEASGFYLPAAFAMNQAKANAVNALRLDDSLSLAHRALAMVLARHDLDLPKAEEHFQRAIELTPKDVAVYGEYAMSLSWFGQFTRADAVLQRGEQVDPKEHNLLGGWCWRFYLGRDFRKAVQAADRLMTLHPNSVIGPWFLALAYEGLRDYTNALAWAERTRQMDSSPDTISQIGRLHARLGHREEAQKALEALRVLAQSPGGARSFAAEVWLALGEYDRAIEDLQREVNEYPPTALWLSVSPLWDELRSDPRFLALLRKGGLEK